MPNIHGGNLSGRYTCSRLHPEKPLILRQTRYNIKRKIDESEFFQHLDLLIKILRYCDLAYRYDG